MKPPLKILIVNADDFNLTEGVNQGILECYDRGILTSATILINRLLKPSWIRELEHRPKLGVGLHLNVTLGEPLSKAARVKSLLLSEGIFRKYPFDFVHDRKSSKTTLLPKALDLATEWKAQILKFKKLFGKLPTHLDTHHQLHDHPFFFAVLAKISQQFKLPVRRSSLLNKSVMPDSIRHPSTGSRVKPGMTNAFHKTTDHLWGDLDSKDPWTSPKLNAKLKKISHGITEVMCHPGYNDPTLKKISSFNQARESEFRLFSSSLLRKKILELGIILANYETCYNWPDL